MCPRLYKIAALCVKLACVLSGVPEDEVATRAVEPDAITFIEDRRLPDGRIERVMRRKLVLPAPGDGDVVEVVDRAEAERDG